MAAEQLLAPEQGFLLAIAGDRSTPVDRWARENAARVRRGLIDHGAVLLRGFEVGPGGLAAVVDAVSERGPSSYAGGGSPRTKIDERTYLSTNVPGVSRILQHHEMSYMRRWPTKLFFHCELPSGTGGETTLCSSRAFMKRLDREVVARFKERGVTYLRNFDKLHGHAGTSWRRVFETDDPAHVDAVCADQGLEREWRAGGTLRTWNRGQATHRHPVTGEEVWFNQVHLLNWFSGHASRWTPALTALAHLPDDLRDRINRMPKDELLFAASYGDGTDIPLDVLVEITSCFDELEVPVAWQAGDLLIADNVLTSHGRLPFAGDRRVLVTLADEHVGAA